MTDRNLSDKRTFYTIPNPNIHPGKRNLAAKWLHNIGTGWSVRNLKFASYLKEYVRTTLRHPTSWMICRQDLWDIKKKSLKEMQCQQFLHLSRM